MSESGGFLSPNSWYIQWGYHRIRHTGHTSVAVLSVFDHCRKCKKWGGDLYGKAAKFGKKNHHELEGQKKRLQRISGKQTRQRRTETGDSQGFSINKTSVICQIINSRMTQKVTLFWYILAFLHHLFVVYQNINVCQINDSSLSTVWRSETGRL